jgi:hypothetical protein
LSVEVLDFLLTSVSSAALLAVVAWFSRTWIEKRLTASIHLETEGRLAKLKAELESTNQTIRDLAATAASANQQVETALLEHRIAAVKLVWETVQNWQQVIAVSMFVSVLPEEWIRQHASHGSTKTTVDQLLNGVDPAKFLKAQNQALLARPFLSEPAWALYFAFHSFLSSRLTKAWLLTLSGLDHSEILSRMNERDLVAKSAPPEILTAYDENASAATEPYLHYLREAMLLEFRKMLSGHSAGKQALEHAAEIVRAAEALTVSSSSNFAKTKSVGAS